MEKRMIPKELEGMFSSITTPVIFATVGKRPHATPMNWFYLGNGLIWISPVGGSSKIRNMLRNENVCFATVEDMKKGARGFRVWGRIVGMETGFRGLMKNFMILRKTLNLRSRMSFKDFKTFRVTHILHVHPDIYYHFGLPWKRYFARIKIDMVEYWLDDGVKKEICL